jgi:hypothetical protein
MGTVSICSSRSLSVFVGVALTADASAIACSDEGALFSISFSAIEYHRTFRGAWALPAEASQKALPHIDWFPYSVTVLYHHIFMLKMTRQLRRHDFCPLA